MFLNDIEHNWIGEIPVDWEVKRIKNVFYLKKEVSENPQDEQILSLTFGGIVKRDVSSNEGQLPETYNGYTKIYPDDIVMNPMDLRSGWIDRSKYNGIISPSYYVLNKNTDEVDIGYFNYQLQRHYKERIFFPFGQGVSYDYRWGMGRETILNFPIIVPPKETQTQIVSFLDTKTQKIDDLIHKTEKKIELLKEKRTSLINHCVTKGLNPNVEMKDSGVEWIGEIPNHWVLVKPWRLFKPEKRKPEYGDEIITCFRDGQVTLRKNRREGGFTNSLKEIGYQRILIGDLVVHEMDGFEGSIGVSDSIGKSTPVYTVISSSSKHNNRFWMYLLREMSNTRYIESLSKSIRERTTEFRWNTWKTQKFPNPQLTEQTQIVEYLDEQTQKIDSTIEKETQRIGLLKEYRQSLISEVVTGKIDVREWDME